MDKKKIAVAAVTAAFAYLFVIPWFWPKPEVQLLIPGEAARGSNPAISVFVSAWHPNFELFAVECVFEVEPVRNAGTAVYPVIIHRAPAKRKKWSFGEVNRLTWPRTRIFSFELPLEKMQKEGLLNGDAVKGRLAVTLDYVRGGRSDRLPGEGYVSAGADVRESFEIILK